MSFLNELVGGRQSRTVSRDSSDGDSLTTIAIEIVKLGVTIGLSVYLINKSLSILESMTGNDPTAKADRQAAQQALAQRLKRPDIVGMKFDEHESKLLADIIAPDEINVSFKDIGGMEEQLEQVRDNVVLPFQIWNHFKTFEGNISSSPTGVLLYGAPGTGKSLTAKAIAKECAAVFINIKASTVMDKWLGESDKMARALFKLGRKLAPSVIFIDEVETLLRKRGGSGDGAQAVQSMQGVFLSEWDGLQADGDERSPPVALLGATNRPMDLDKAFLRRMPVQIKTVVPDQQGRLSILRAKLVDESLGPDVSLVHLATNTEGFTGSDIRELIRVAALQRSKSYIKSMKGGMEKMVGVSANSGSVSGINHSSGSGDSGSPNSPPKVSTRPLLASDFEYALQRTNSSMTNTSQYNQEFVAAEMRESMERKINAYKEAIGSLTSENAELVESSQPVVE